MTKRIRRGKTDRDAFRGEKSLHEFCKKLHTL